MHEHELRTLSRNIILLVCPGGDIVANCFRQWRRQHGECLLVSVRSHGSLPKGFRGNIRNSFNEFLELLEVIRIHRGRGMTASSGEEKELLV